MVGVNEIRNKIQTIKNTQKITKAMEMVAISKMRKTEEKMRSGRPYSNTIKRVISHLTQGNLEYKHDYLIIRPVKRIGFIVVSTDRGLCGSLNINLFKKILICMKEYFDRNISFDLTLFGLKGLLFFNTFDHAIVSKVTNIGDTPSSSSLIGATKVLLEKYSNNQIDRIFIAYNNFFNRMSQIPIIFQLLPLDTTIFEKNIRNKSQWDYLYEPDDKLILDILLNRYVETQIYQAVLENLACEQAARMIAMKNATDNSEDFIEELQLVYNKIRQTSITQELTEIISGASAISLD